jgi:acyl carrier protein
MLLEALERHGAFTVAYEEADVSTASDVARLLERIADPQRPLRGIVHAAGVLADATLLQQSWPRFLDVMAPKVFGAWHLHQLTTALPLDHFVCFSSSASILGAAGQGNYAAANSFLDALAHHRHALGRPALCINWGPWDEVGMTATLDPRARAQRANQGIHAIAPARALRLLEHAMLQPRPQIGILSVDWHVLLKGAAPILRRSSVFKDLAAAVSTAALQPAGGEHPLPRQFAGAAPEERPSIVHAYVLDRVTRLLGAEARHLDPDDALTLQGFDSLMALELREQVEADLQIAMPILTFFRSNSINALSTYVLGELEKRYAGAQPPVPVASPSALLSRLHELSDDEVDRALRQELRR